MNFCVPIYHKTYEDFKKKVDNALLYESVGFHLFWLWLEQPGSLK